MKFKNTYLKLTGLYVLIIMVISIVFSTIVYQISSMEFGRGFGRQAKIIQNFSFTSPDVQDFEKARVEQIKEFNRKLITNLFFLNLAILFVSAFLSYYLARRTMQPIEEALENQSRFTADASHELRTPLTAMRAEIEVSLRDKNLNLKEAKSLLKSNLEEIGKLEYLSSSLLKLARSGDDSIKFDQVSLTDILETSIKKVKPLAEKKSILIKSKLINASIKGDRMSLVELFTILIDNAVKYSPNNSIVNINFSKEKEKLVVKIKDRGIGIKASDVAYIFNRFYRADISRSKEKVDGYGLGLSIAKKIADMHQAKITVVSVPNKGSEFSVIF